MVGLLVARCYYWGVSASSMAILGNVAMQGLTVVFDREVDQIGFATVSPEEKRSYIQTHS